MKKRWLIVLTSVLMALTLCLGFAACKKDKGLSDAEIAQKAIASLRVLYEGETTTSKDFTVLGKTKVGENLYDVEWTATAKTQGITIGDYVTIGETDSTTYQKTITIKQGDIDIEYTLTASVTVGEATEKIDFAKKIPGPVKLESDGSAEHPFSVADVKAISDTLENGSFYQKDGADFRAYIHGFVISPGSYQEASGGYPAELKQVDIADTADSTDTVRITYLVFNDLMPDPGDKSNPLSAGDEIVVWGYIEKYNNYPSIYYINGVYPELTKWTKAVKTDAQVVAEAKSALKIGETEYRITGDFSTIPGSQSGATVTWALKAASDNVEIKDGKLSIKSLPTADTTVTLVATITKGEESDTKEFEIKVGPALATEHAGTAVDPYSCADLFKKITSFVGNGYLGGSKEEATEIYAKGYIVSIDGWSSDHKNWTKVYIGDTKGAATADQVQLYRLALDETYIKTQADLVVGSEITVKGYLQKYNGKPEVSDNGTNNVTAVAYTKAETTEPEVPAGATRVTLSIADYADQKSWESSTGYGTINIDSNITATATGTAVGDYGLNTGKYYTTGENWRIYQNESPKLTFTAATGCTIVSIKITYDLKNTGILQSEDGTHNYASGAVIAVNATTVTFTVGNTVATTTNGNIQITAIEVIYTGGTPATPKTDAEKVADFKATYTLSKTELTEVDEAIDLPTTSGEATLAWTLQGTSEFVTLSNNKLTVTKLPTDEDKTVTLKVTITIGTAHDDKDITITVKKPAAQAANALTLTAAKAFADVEGSSYAAHDGDHTVEGYTVTTSNVMKTTYATEEAIQFKSSSGTLILGGNFTTITMTFLSTSQYASMKMPTVTAGTATLTATKGTVNTNTGNKVDVNKTPTDVLRHIASYTVTGEGVQCITIKSGSATTYITSIELALAEGATAHTHTLTFASKDDTNHTGTCSVCKYTFDAEHRYASNDDTTCEDCTYTRTIDNSIWTKVTDVATLKAGDKIVLVSGEFVNGGMNGAVISAVKGVTDGDTANTVKLPSGAKELTLAGTADGWTLTLEGKTVVVTSTSDNAKMATKDTPADTDKSEWTITIDATSGAATIALKGVTSGAYLLQANTSSLRFANYKSTSNQTNPIIYIKSAPAE